MTTAEMAAEAFRFRTRKPTSLWRDAWRRLLRNKLAIAGMVILVLFLIMALLADDGLIAIQSAGLCRVDRFPVPCYV